MKLVLICLKAFDYGHFKLYELLLKRVDNKEITLHSGKCELTSVLILSYRIS